MINILPQFILLHAALTTTFNTDGPTNFAIFVLHVVFKRMLFIWQWMVQRLLQSKLKNVYWHLGLCCSIKLCITLNLYDPSKQVPSVEVKIFHKSNWSQSLSFKTLREKKSAILIPSHSHRRHLLFKNYSKVYDYKQCGYWICWKLPS